MSDLAHPSPPAHPWDGYLIGPENALAQAGALALARGETVGVSPLVVHGPSGSGKSRLLAGLVAERLLRRPESAVAHLEAEAFAAACAEASGRPGGWAEVRERFRRLDLFVLDDLQTLERTPWAMEELSHTLDALDEAGAAVAVAARSGPGQWSGWPTRLANRLVGGLSVRIEPAFARVAPPLPARPRPSREGWPCRPRSSSRWPRRPTATGRSTAGSPSSNWRAGSSAASSPPTSSSRSCAATRSDGPTLDEIARAVAEKFGLKLRDLRGLDPPGRRRRGPAPGHVPGQAAHPAELPGDRRLFRRPRPRDRPPRLPGRRRADRRRPRPPRRLRGPGEGVEDSVPGRRVVSSLRRGPPSKPVGRWWPRCASTPPYSVRPSSPQSSSGSPAASVIRSKEARVVV